MRALYISHNSIGSALVRSQVLPYLRHLAQSGATVELITYERGSASIAPDEFPRERVYPIRARPGRHLLAKALDVAAGIVLTLRIARAHRLELLHARSHLPAAIAWATGWLLRIPFVFDVRGFLGDEYVEGGNWTKRDLRYHVVRIAELVLLRGAAEIVVLTEQAARKLREDPRYARAVARTPITVAPCAVDLARFRPLPERGGRPTLVYSGSLGTWYMLEEMLRVYRHARELLPELRFLILNRDEHRMIHVALERHASLSDGIELRAVPFDDMPRVLAESHVGIALIRQVGSKLASSPIKVSEYLACGLPVVVNAGLGDTGELVRRFGAGHVVRAYDDQELRRAGDAVVRLLDDQTARANARRCAEAEYALDAVAARYAAVYERLARRTTGAAAST